MTDQEKRCEENRKNIYDKISESQKGIYKVLNPLVKSVGKLEGKFLVLCAFAVLVVAALFANMNLYMSSLQRQLDKMESRWEKVMSKVEAGKKKENKVALRW